MFLLPFDDLQIQYSDAVENRHEKQSDECGHTETADLRVAKWLPERTTVNGQGE